MAQSEPEGVIEPVAPQDGPLRAFWLSWYSPADMSTFELHSPWWISGYDADDNEIVCAAVRATDDEAARARIAGSYDEPQWAIAWRFTEEMTPVWSPFTGRFPQAEWMAWTAEATCACGQDNCSGR